MIERTLQNILTLTTEMSAAVEGNDFDLLSNLLDQRAELVNQLKASGQVTTLSATDAALALRDAIASADEAMADRLTALEERHRLALEEIGRLRTASRNYSGADGVVQILRTDLVG